MKAPRDMVEVSRLPVALFDASSDGFGQHWGVPHDIGALSLEDCTIDCVRFPRSLLHFHATALRHFEHAGVTLVTGRVTYFGTPAEHAQRQILLRVEARVLTMPPDVALEELVYYQRRPLAVVRAGLVSEIRSVELYACTAAGCHRTCDCGPWTSATRPARAP